MPTHHVTFPSADAEKTALAGVLTLPDGPGPHPGVVMCHPHPQQGGAMTNHVVLEVCDALAPQGIASLRFNFRGVGDSGGSYTGGPGEEQDALGALAFLTARPEIDPARAGLAGYSFGARISLNIAGRAPIAALAVVSGIAQLPGDDPQFAGLTMPKLFISGERDHFIPPERLAAFVEKLPPPATVQIVPHVDHFWVGSSPLMGEAVAAFFTKALK